MARVTVRVDIPSGSPEEMMKLGNKVIETDAAAAADSKLDPDKISALADDMKTAAQQHADMQKYMGLAQAARVARDTALGTADGQTVNTKGTALYVVTKVRDQLLLDNEDNPEVLTNYGFNVVVGSAKTPTKTPAAATQAK